MKTKKLVYILIIFLISFESFGINTVDTGYDLFTGTYKKINAHSVCKAVIYLGAGPNVFIPTKTASEWTGFRNAPPAGILVNPCCSGYEDSGYCYYLAAKEQSCNAFCFSKGGPVLSGIALTQIDSINKCNELIQGITGSITLNDLADYEDITQAGTGCTYLNFISKMVPYHGVFREFGSAVTREAVHSNVDAQRLCACDI
ncbi:MAG: hypothetical protein HN576_02690 [Bacteriovoracaceae bacterium]|nr:hypothetical protein [Bacteriovoracaceae bacterium]